MSEKKRIRIEKLELAFVFNKMKMLILRIPQNVFAGPSLTFRQKQPFRVTLKGYIFLKYKKHL